MSTPSLLRSRRVALLAAAIPLVLGLSTPSRATAQLPDRARVNTRAVADSFSYRIATFTPTSGPIGTKVVVRWQYLPALTPIHVSLGALHVGFEVLKDILTDRNGEFTDTIVIPDWAESTRPHALVVQDFYFVPLAISSNFLVTERDGTVSRDGRIQPSTGRCAILKGDDDDVYNLIGDIQGLKVGDRATIKGTLANPAQCGGGKDDVTIRITSVRKGFSG